MEKIENIKNLLQEILKLDVKRTEIIEVLSSEFKVKPTTVECNWISKGYYPDKHLDRLVEILQNLIYNKNIS